MIQDTTPKIKNSNNKSMSKCLNFKLPALPAGRQAPKLKTVTCYSL